MRSSEITKRIHTLNYLTAELDALYHQASVKLGLADCATRILYAIHDNGDGCLLSLIYKESGISRQTVNSALRKLEAEGVVYLERREGRSKAVCLTEAGRELVERTVERLCQAELRALGTWADREIDEHIRLTQKYLTSFREQVEDL